MNRSLELNNTRKSEIAEQAIRKESPATIEPTLAFPKDRLLRNNHSLSPRSRRSDYEPPRFRRGAERRRSFGLVSGAFFRMSHTHRGGLTPWSRRHANRFRAGNGLRLIVALHHGAVIGRHQRVKLREFSGVRTVPSTMHFANDGIGA